MRIQEHLFQGFFGIKKKEDSAKYYSQRVSKLKGLDEDLDKCISEFQKILKNHSRKIEAYNTFLKELSVDSFKKVKNEVMKLERMFDEDELSNESERRYVLKMEDVLTDITSNEENTELKQIHKETMQDLKELLRMIEGIKPLWEKQLKFMEQDSEYAMSKEGIKELTEIFKQESNLLKIEESLLKKIDLKTGSILRKTTLKMRNLEKTKDMNMTYRNIKHIR